MKKGAKIIGFFMLVLCLLVSMTGVAFADSTTGLKDGVYASSSSPDAQGSSFKITNMVVADGKVTSFEFGWYNGSMKLTTSMAQQAPKEVQASMLATLEEVTDYHTQMATVLDGAKVTKYAKAADSKVYTTFQTLWKDVVKQAGGQIVADTTSTTSSSNPKTGDSGILVYVIVAGAALIGMTVLRKKKLTV
jgi:LPXTG-motif cell wall-anchored protein